jgi:hypothetical protein
MTPSQFFSEVCWPNVVEALEHPQSVRSCANAILTLDALMGCIFWHLRDAGRLDASRYPDDDSSYKEELAASSNDSIREVRDAAFALKHGRLTRKPKVAPPRVMNDVSQMVLAANGLGSFRVGDLVSGGLVFLELKTGTIDARTVIGRAGNFLKNLVADVDHRTAETGAAARPFPR